MSTPGWQPGKIYPKGSVVSSSILTGVSPVPVANGSFETGDSTGWQLDTGASIGTWAYVGSYAVQFTFIGPSGIVRATSDAKPCPPGFSLAASCYYQQGAASSGHNVGTIFVSFHDASGAIIGPRRYGNAVASGSGAAWNLSSVSAVAPAGTESVRVGVEVDRDRSDTSAADSFSWNLTTASNPADRLFKAVQPEPGTSGATEPAWPNTVGVQVTDNTVIWEAIAGSYVEWTASPILESGATEPVWPTTIGEMVSDGTISWECISRRVEDDNCPNSKVVAIMSSKVFAADGDIVRFSATTNPLDWSSQDDAGYLPTGLQQASADDLLVLQPYRGNLAAFNTNCFQLWQTDPDPALMSLLDQMDGIGSQYTLAACGVGNDLFYLAALGVRSIGIANAAQNMQAGDVGMPIDPLTQEAISQVAQSTDGKFISTYYPSAGQYWLAWNLVPSGGGT